MDRICPDHMLPNEDFDRMSEERFVRDQSGSPVMGEEQEQCFDYTQNSNIWRPQEHIAELTRNPGYDQVYFHLAHQHLMESQMSGSHFSCK